MKKLKAGDKAPDFKLENQNGELVSLKDFKGQNVLVYFYPKAMTPGCTVQAQSLRDVKKELKKLDVVVLGISADPIKSLKKFEEKDSLNFNLLSDPDHEALNAYGAWGPKKFMGREYDGIHRFSFLIDKKGKIAHILDKVKTKSHHEEVLELFEEMDS